MGWPGSVGFHCQLPRSRHGSPGEVGGKNSYVYCACVRLSVTQIVGNRLYFQKAKCFYSYTTKKLFSLDKYLSEASHLQNFKTTVF